MTEDRDITAISRLAAVPTILRVITETTGLRLALVARVTEDDWKACAVHDTLGFGLSVGDHLDVATTLCTEVRAARKSIVIEHASDDPVYCGHPTPKMYAFESYVAVPIFFAKGDYFGNVCALDSKPLPLFERKAEAMMTLFAQLIALQLDADERVRHAKAALYDANQASELREQFIAVLGHDLRNPLAAIISGADSLLMRGQLAPAHHRTVDRIRASGRRMSRLVDDVLALCARSSRRRNLGGARHHR